MSVHHEVMINQRDIKLFLTSPFEMKLFQQNRHGGKKIIKRNGK